MGAESKPTLLQISMFSTDAIDYNSREFVAEYLVVTYQLLEARNQKDKIFIFSHLCQRGGRETVR